MSHPPKFPSHAKPEPTRIESLAAKEPNAEGRKPGCVVECCKVLPRGHAAHPLLISAPIMSVRPGGRRADMRPSVGSLGEPAVSAMCSARRSKAGGDRDKPGPRRRQTRGILAAKWVLDRPDYGQISHPRGIGVCDTRTVHEPQCRGG